MMRFKDSKREEQVEQLENSSAMLCQESFGTHEVALANDSLTPDCTWFHIQGTCPFQLQTLSHMFDHNSIIIIIIIIIHYLIIS